MLSLGGGKEGKGKRGGGIELDHLLHAHTHTHKHTKKQTKKKREGVGFKRDY